MGYPTTVDTGQVQPQIIDNEVASYTLNTSALSANTVYLWAFELSTSVVITGMRFRNGTTATGATNLGIYTAAGNLVAGSDTGAQTDAVSTTKTATYATPVVLGPGQYFLALACNNATDTFNALTPAFTDASRAKRATNVLAAGALPATTGAIVINTSFAPALAALVSGGLA